MTTNPPRVEKTALNDWIDTVYGITRGDTIPKERFLHEAWGAIANIVHYNKENKLMRESVQKYPDLTPRTFTILTVLYGAYSSPPNKRSLLRDFVGMIDKDLIKESDEDLGETELKVWEYAKQASKDAFFPELASLLTMVYEIYNSEHFNPKVMPPTLYQGFALFALNHADRLGGNLRPEELFGYLYSDDSRFKEIFSLAKPRTQK
jgi:hypothetical protein